MLLSVCLIGCGNIGVGFEFDDKRKKPASHIGALNTLGHQFWRMIICDTDKMRLQKAHSILLDSLSPLINLGIHSEQDYKVVITEYETPDLVIVATPTETHYPIISSFLKAGKRPRVIFCEKPLAQSIAEGRKLVQECADAHVSLCVNHTRRWDWAWRNVKSWVERGQIGELESFVGTFSGDRMSVGVHMADLANWFAAKGSTLVGAYKVPYLLFEVDLIGTKGRIKVLENGSWALVSKGFKESEHYSGIYELNPAQRFEPSDLSDSLKTPLWNAYDNIIAHIEENEPLRCTGEDGLKALDRLETADHRLDT